MSRFDPFVQRLLNGESHSTVLEAVRKTKWFDKKNREREYTKDTLKKNISKIRAKVIQTLVPKVKLHISSGTQTQVNIRVQSDWYRHSEYDITPLLTYSDEPGVNTFVNADLATQIKIKQQHMKRPTWSVHAEAALAKIKLLPENVFHFKLTADEYRELRIKGEKSRMLANSDLIVIPNAQQLLVWAQEQLHIHHKTIGPLVLSLMLLSGRRITELTSPRSHFQPVSSNVCLFKGQLKKRSNEAFEYPIPLLCDVNLFLHGMTTLHQLLFRNYGSTLPWDNETISNKINARVRDNFPRTLPLSDDLMRTLKNKQCGPKVLRKAYLQYVISSFQIPCTLSMLAYKILGHENEDGSLHYACVRLEGYNVEQMPFPISITNT